MIKPYLLSFFFSVLSMKAKFSFKNSGTSFDKRELKLSGVNLITQTSKELVKLVDSLLQNISDILKIM